MIITTNYNGIIQSVIINNTLMKKYKLTLARQGWCIESWKESEYSNDIWDMHCEYFSSEEEAKQQLILISWNYEQRF